MLGAFMGGSTSETRLDLNAGRTDTDTLFGGAYVRAFFGASFLDLALIGGKLDNDAKRNIGGGPAFQTASASYGGWFINPLVTLGHAFALDNGLTLTPAFKVRYVAAHFDGYAETGSTANLTVAGRDMQAFEERAELTLANVQYWNDNRITWRMTGGALARQHTGDANVNAILLGTNFIAATPDKKNVAGLYGSWGIDWQVGRVALFAVGEIAGMNDQTTTFAGRGGMRVVW
jgi:outer membrane autotransporter protein